MFEFDKDLVPTGKYKNFETFNSFKQIGDEILNDSFELTPSSDIACTILDRKSKI